MRMWAGKWIREQEGREMKIKLVDIKSSETWKISIIILSGIQWGLCWIKPGSVWRGTTVSNTLKLTVRTENERRHRLLIVPSEFVDDLTKPRPLWNILSGSQKVSRCSAPLPTLTDIWLYPEMCSGMNIYTISCSSEVAFFLYPTWDSDT